MVNYHSQIPSGRSFVHQLNMANSFGSEDKLVNAKQPHQFQRQKKQAPQSNTPKLPPCEGSQSAAIDIIILIAVLGSCGFLVFPYVKLFCRGIVEISSLTIEMLRTEVAESPAIYGFIGLSFLISLGATVGFLCSARKCDNPKCRGLRKAAEFDIQLETEECVKNSSSKTDEAKGLFELGEGHHKELEAELKKMAPPNGRAVLVFRARCGCPVGRLQVWGPKKLKKIKK